MASKTAGLRNLTLLLMVMCLVWGWEVLECTLRSICANSRWVRDRFRIVDGERVPLLVAIENSMQAVAPLVLFAAVALLVDAEQSYDPHAAKERMHDNAWQAVLRGLHLRPDSIQRPIRPRTPFGERHG